MTSPQLANLFLHYTFDMWMQRELPSIPFERYADDAVCHCRTEAQAKYLKARLERRFAECSLELHPEKTKIVYCKDDNRAGEFPQTQFDFLGYTFRSRLARRGDGKFFVSFSPAISGKAAKAIRQTVRGWALQRRTNQSLYELAQAYDPAIRGWGELLRCLPQVGAVTDAAANRPEAGLVGAAQAQALARPQAQSGPPGAARRASRSKPLCALALDVWAGWLRGAV